MSASIKLISLNIERSLHLDLVLPFLKEQQADVVCLQELSEPDISLFESELGSKCVFAPMIYHHSDTGSKPVINGNAVLTRLPLQSSMINYYVGDGKKIHDEPPGYIPDHEALVMVETDNEKGGDVFRIMTTHFTWTPDGSPSDAQRRDMKKLLHVLETLGEFVLAGDFNAPRGGEIFSMLAQKYKDNVPPHYVTSLDQKLHRAVKLRPHEIVDKMVDGIFSTPSYTVSDVEMVSGLSDHCALVATVSKV
ncbi:hypothetical protein A3H16_01920 [Candidatus Kaiserbacteria bacterium RIFCSPLOWO2_12_FULL_53_8]|uniref:Endonuclease/exonuclease/phosphatase domain-containing protein n=2 Tax=Candidatus Kaiseribacteriota TaxID=1752734 RepID=A0A1F6CWE4_9BACT|nr:MAG: hypothetical protein A2851_04045 [Candidatus Kaiserbacteria bacterium RIFCSPHIGHO2_01_FULL_53_29]OGG91881.1 MAG: hypothetical protein A3H16_01920 [Candidatus Kaiserbacteria bacterium RIFCSPLOWO2_12_FULL_53_8]